MGKFQGELAFGDVSGFHDSPSPEGPKKFTHPRYRRLILAGVEWMFNQQCWGFSEIFTSETIVLSS